METIRGVNCDYAVSKLLEKDLIVITGRKEDAPGQPLLYGTSKSFMDYFGINSTDDLPKLEDILVNQTVEPTVVQGDLPLEERAEEEEQAETASAPEVIYEDGEPDRSIQNQW